ncbi:hypothetical protein B0H14DRAFT_3514540 [Mycena olivaceomarginata]|nr:hypothetical protein B0H14DRAFT_3514540 [Mycena olivaceomarginata]
MPILLLPAYIDDAVVLLAADDPLCSGPVCVYVILSSSSSSVGGSCTLGRTRTRMRFDSSKSPRSLSLFFLLVRIILPSFNIHGSLCILGTCAHIIVFQDLARSLLPLTSTTTTHHDIKLKYPITSLPGGPVDAPVNSIAARLGVTPDQVLLAWTKANGAVVVTTSSKKERLLGYFKRGGYRFHDAVVKVFPLFHADWKLTLGKMTIGGITIFPSPRIVTMALMF